ncbi:MAG: DUF3784 domain-containing protein [Syntrophomonadaceae bacterium]|nr:DUF3784 domain-containing protein [Syntrophomonadaceae bacterium]
MDLYITLFIIFMLAGLATLIKYRGGEGWIAGYNTASSAEQKYMAEKGIGAFVGNYLYFLAGIILAGYIGKKAGLVWGEAIAWGLFTVTIMVMLIRAQRFQPPAAMTRPGSARIQKIALGVVGIILLAIAGLVIWGGLPPQFNLEDRQFRITGIYGMAIQYSAIDDIVLQADLPPVGMKIDGFNLGPVLKGQFQVKGWGSTRLFLRSPTGPVILITFKNHSSPMLINFSNPAATVQLYQQLKARLE